MYLLVGMADTRESTIKKFEKDYSDGEDIGSEMKPEKKTIPQRQEWALRLIRTSSKCFAASRMSRTVLIYLG